MTYNLTDKKIWVAGHNGMVGAAIVRRLQEEGCEVLITPRDELDLTRQADVEDWVAKNKPDAVFLAAAKVGGIHANNTYPAEFLYENLAIEANIIHAAYINKVEKLVFLGSSCIYPKHAPQPMKEEDLLTGPLEQTNEWYAVAKIAGIKLCQAYRKQYGCDFVSVMPTNLYGPGDNYHPENSHVPAALIRRFHEAKEARDSEVVIWGTGAPLREFMHVDDMADACVFVMKNYSDDEFLNVGTGEEISIQDFANTVAQMVGYTGKVKNDLSKPDGTMRKLIDSSKLRGLGWMPSYTLTDGLAMTYEHFCEHGGRNYDATEKKRA
ncbi:MAG: GDP-L-fucose synthase [Alphaproteobacteria bacterium]|nr:GDP-L-fucose synthase [Alphaproteobacteria bacterium]